MKKLIIKNEKYFFIIAVVFTVLGSVYPAETSFENYLAAGFYIIAAIAWFLIIVNAILNILNKKWESV